MTRRVLFGLAASVVVLAGSCVDGANNRDHAKQRACADRLGIRWTVQDGATERLTAFSECMEGSRP